MGSWLGGKLSLTETSTWASIVSKIEGVSLSGTATAGHVLTGKTFYNTTLSKVTGTMANRGSINVEITGTASDQTYTIPIGFHDGSGVVKILGTNLVATSIATSIGPPYSTSWTVETTGIYVFIFAGPVVIKTGSKSSSDSDIISIKYGSTEMDRLCSYAQAASESGGGIFQITQPRKCNSGGKIIINGSASTVLDTSTNASSLKCRLYAVRIYS